jgi:hypothetical protein
MLRAAAANIVNAMMLGSLPELKEELDRAARLTETKTPLSPYASERLELLDAITGQMRDSLGRLRRPDPADLPGLEANLWLLNHLARSR